MTEGDRPDPLTPTIAEPTTLGTQPVGRITLRDIPDYDLGDVIGRGGMGEVIVARHRRIGREVALKRMRAEQPTPEHVERFLREAKIQARLDHPAIAPVHELGFDSEGLPYFTMKRVGGATLSALLEGKTEKPQRLLRALVDVCQAIDLAHARKIVHRDLKPANIMLGDYGEVYVLDWGVARVLTSERDQTAPVTKDIESLDGGTKAGALLGTPGYMSPEQVRGEEVGPAADVYALGSMLFEILAGEPLHPRSDALSSTISNADLSPSQRRVDRTVPPELDAICVKALASDPTKRPTARELATAIQDYLDGDRDVERRRALANDLAASARTELERGNNAQAMRRAGRALALDPTSREASTIVSTIVLSEPAEIPHEVEQQLDADEQRMTRNRSRRAVLPYAAIFGLLPFLPLLHVNDWGLLIATFVAFGGMVTITYLNSRYGVPVWLTLIGHSVTALLFSRLLGPFIITPIMLCAILLSATSLPYLSRRPFAVLVWTVGTTMLPFVMEWAHLLPPSWTQLPTGLLSYGSIFDTAQMYDGLIIFGHVSAVSLVALYARRIGRDRRDAQRKLFLQAWHLRQLLPKAATA